MEDFVSALIAKSNYFPPSSSVLCNLPSRMDNSEYTVFVQHNSTHKLWQT